MVGDVGGGDEIDLIGGSVGDDAPADWDELVLANVQDDDV